MAGRRRAPTATPQPLATLLRRPHAAVEPAKANTESRSFATAPVGARGICPSGRG
jgi:hypothetical protein